VCARCVLPRNADKDIRSFGACQGPGWSPLVAEGVRLGCVVVSHQYSIPWVHLLTVNSDKADLVVFDGPEVHGPEVHGPGGPLGPAVHGVSDGEVSEDARVRAFKEYREELADKVVIIQNRGDKEMVKVIRQADSSRYFPEGRRRIRGKIYKRMGKWWNCPGYLLSCTFDPKMISKRDAWREVGSRGSRLEDAVNVWRKRNGMPKVRGIRVLEPQKGTGYPHLHFAYPNLRWLAPIEKLTEWWDQAVNSVDYKVKDSFSPVGYVCKYVTKLESWPDEALAEIWLNKSRVYSMSDDYYLVPDEKRVPEWSFKNTARLSSVDSWLRALVGEYESVLGADDLCKEVFLGSGKG
jgi:hypothetical protein